MVNDDRLSTINYGIQPLLSLFNALPEARHVPRSWFSAHRRASNFRCLCESQVEISSGSYNDLTATSLEMMVFIGTSSPKASIQVNEFSKIYRDFIQRKHPRVYENQWSHGWSMDDLWINIIFEDFHNVKLSWLVSQ